MTGAFPVEHFTVGAMGDDCDRGSIEACEELVRVLPAGGLSTAVSRYQGPLSECRLERSGNPSKQCEAIDGGWRAHVSPSEEAAWKDLAAATVAWRATDYGVKPAGVTEAYCRHWLGNCQIIGGPQEQACVQGIPRCDPAGRPQEKPCCPQACIDGFARLAVRERNAVTDVDYSKCAMRTTGGP